MSLPLKMTKPTRRVRCQVPGCRNRDAIKISRRNDVNGNPLYMCEECMDDIQKLRGTKTKKAAKTTEEKNESEKAIEAEIVSRTRAKVDENAGGVFTSAVNDTSKSKK